MGDPDDFPPPDITDNKDAGRARDGGTHRPTPEAGIVGIDGAMLDGAMLDGAMDAKTDIPESGLDDAAGLDATTDGAIDTDLDAAVDSGDESDPDAAVDSGDESDPDAAVDSGNVFDGGCETLDSVEHCGACDHSCPDNGGTAVCTAGECDTHCDLSGTFALKLTLDATWPSNDQVEGDSGTLEFWLKVRATHDGDEVAVQMRDCGRTIPPLYAYKAREHMLFTYPDSLYDAEVLPIVSSSITLGDSSIDSPLSLPLVAFQMGIDLPDPVNDPWPNSLAGIPASMRVDTDNDGHPGITGVNVGTRPYDYPRTSTSISWNAPRARDTYLGVRWSVALNGALTSCDTSAGDASFARLDARIYGCRLTNGSQCDASDANHLDTNSPDYQLGDAGYVLSRVADDASCPDVRAALP